MRPLAGRRTTFGIKHTDQSRGRRGMLMPGGCLGGGPTPFDAGEMLTRPSEHVGKAGNIGAGYGSFSVRLAQRRARVRPIPPTGCAR